MVQDRGTVAQLNKVALHSSAPFNDGRFFDIETTDLYFGDGSGVAYSYDFSDPANPTENDQIQTGQSVLYNGVSLREDESLCAYGGSGGQNTTILDTSDPSNLSIASELSVNSNDGVLIAGDSLVIGDFNAGDVLFYDISDPANPSDTGTTSFAPGTIWEVVPMTRLQGGTTSPHVAIETGGFVEVYDVSDPANPSYVVGVSHPFGGSVESLNSDGDYLYVSTRDGDDTRNIAYYTYDLSAGTVGYAGQVFTPTPVGSSTTHDGLDTYAGTMLWSTSNGIAGERRDGKGDATALAEGNGPNASFGTTVVGDTLYSQLRFGVDGMLVATVS